jgi:hypothetical protein
MIFRSENYTEGGGGGTPFFAVGAKNMDFFGFLRISLKWKNPGKFFSTRKKRLHKGNPTVQNSLPYVA